MVSVAGNLMMRASIYGTKRVSPGRKKSCRGDTCRCAADRRTRRDDGRRGLTMRKHEARHRERPARAPRRQQRQVVAGLELDDAGYFESQVPKAKSPLENARRSLAWCRAIANAAFWAKALILSTRAALPALARPGGR